MTDHCLDKCFHVCAREKEGISCDARHVVLRGGEPHMLAVEPRVHGGGGALLVGWRGESEILVWLAAAVQEGSLEG